MCEKTNETRRYFFSKEERLCSQKLIKELFEKGSSFSLYPIRVIFLPKMHESPAGSEALFTVSKKRFKKAVNRNKIKRRMREAYRQNKHILDNQPDRLSFYIGFIYIGKEMLPYKLIEDKLKISFKRLSEVKL